MPSTIRDLTELTAMAVDDYLLISDTSDVTNRDKRISQANLLSNAAKKTGTPVLNRVASWLDANTVQDAGFLVADIARLSQNQTFTGNLTINNNIVFPARRGLTVAGESINDQTALFINDLGSSGIIVISVQGRATSNAIIAYRNNGTPQCYILAQPSTALCEVSTVGALNGTTGTNGKFTFSVSAVVGNAWLENRLGAVLTFIITKLSF